MEIKPKSLRDIRIKNGKQVFQIQTANLMSEDIFNLFFSEKYEIRKCEKGHIVIVCKKTY